MSVEMHQRRMITSLFLVLATLIVGCGGGTSDDPPEAADRFSAAWVVEVNEVCRDARAESEELGSRYPADDSGTMKYLRAMNRNFHAFIDELRRIDVPSDATSQYEEMIRRYEQALKSQELLVTALEGGDSAAAEREDAAVMKWGDEGDKIALRLSLRDCALDPGEKAPFENSP